MNNLLFYTLNFFISANIIPFFIFSYLVGMAMFGIISEDYYIWTIFLFFFINLVIKTMIYPLLYKISKIYQKSNSFWNNLTNISNRKKHIKRFLLIDIFTSLIFLIYMFKGLLVYALLLGGSLVSYISLLFLIRNKKKFIFVFCTVFSLFILFFTLSFANIYIHTINQNTDMNKYFSMYKKINKAYGDKATKHFPKTLPENITDYYFEYEQSFHGYNLDYVKFSTDENYIKEVKKQNKCQKYDTKSNLYQQNIKIPLNDLGYDDKICIIDYQDYITGIAFKENTVFFFFQNYR